MNVLSSILNFIGNKIGNTALGTTATTITGAIAEHQAKVNALESNRSYTFSFSSLADMANQLSTLGLTVCMFRGDTNFCGELGGDLANHTCGGYVYKLSSVTYDMCVISSLNIYKCRYRSDTSYINVTKVG